MEIARHWRLQGDRYNLRGEIRELEDGRVQFRLNGSSSWTEPQPNGHFRNENPLAGETIYQREESSSDNDHEPGRSHGTVEIITLSG